MLTYEEVRECVRITMRMSADDFEKFVADDMPQSIIPDLLEDMVGYFITMEGLHPVAAASATAHFMAGFQLGWMTKTKAVAHGS